MRIVKQSLALALLGSLLVSAAAAAQQGGTDAFKWYVGGHGGVTSFRTAPDGRDLMPVAGGHLLVTAKRTGLLLSVDQGFGSDHNAQTFYQIVDSTNSVASSGVRNWTFSGIRRYSAILVAYPVRNPNIQPFVGIGGGIMHTTGNSQGPFAGRQRRERAQQRGLRHRDRRPRVPSWSLQRLRPVSGDHQAGLQAAGHGTADRRKRKGPLQRDRLRRVDSGSLPHDHRRSSVQPGQRARGRSQRRVLIGWTIRPRHKNGRRIHGSAARSRWWPRGRTSTGGCSPRRPGRTDFHEAERPGGGLGDADPRGR